YSRSVGASAGAAVCRGGHAPLRLGFALSRCGRRTARRIGRVGRDVRIRRRAVGGPRRLHREIDRGRAKLFATADGENGSARESVAGGSAEAVRLYAAGAGADGGSERSGSASGSTAKAIAGNRAAGCVAQGQEACRYGGRTQ